MTLDEQRIVWLTSHQDIWQGWPNAPYSDTNIINRMKEAGLFSKKTHNAVNLGRFITIARSRMKGR